MRLRKKWVFNRLVGTVAPDGRAKKCIINIMYSRRFN